ncbi:MAG: ribbon-helix-helix domain-containing protein [archaeon]
MICSCMKERITITLDRELLEWLDAKISERVFANRSHGFEFLVADMIKNEGKNNNNAG